MLFEALKRKKDKNCHVIYIWKRSETEQFAFDLTEQLHYRLPFSIGRMCYLHLVSRRVQFFDKDCWRLHVAKWFLIFATTAILAGPSIAHEEDFDARVRAYILNNPEVILDALEGLSAREEKARIQTEIARHAAIFDEAASLGLGTPDAPVRVIEFFDYRCAPCKAIHPELSAFVSDNPNVRVEMMQLPILSPGSERAARFALAAKEFGGSETYAKVHEALWSLRGPMTEPGFQKISGEIGIDFDQIKPFMDSPQVDAEITRNRDIAIDLGVLGTPAFLTPNSVLFGNMDVDEMARAWLSQ